MRADVGRFDENRACGSGARRLGGDATGTGRRAPAATIEQSVRATDHHLPGVGAIEGDLCDAAHWRIVWPRHECREVVLRRKGLSSVRGDEDSVRAERVDDAGIVWIDERRAELGG